MKRRDFLRYGIGISLASSSLYSLANMREPRTTWQYGDDAFSTYWPNAN